MLFSPSLSWTVSCSILCMALVLLLLHTALKWPVLLHSVQVFPYARYCLWGMAVTTVSACLFHGHLCVSSGTVLVYIFDTFILSNSFAFVRLFMTADWAFCAPTLFAHANTFWLSFIFVSSKIISPSISVSFKPCMDCSFSCLSSS